MLPKNGVLYKAYLLRLWADSPDTPVRAALECARTGERHPFATMTDLVAFLESEAQAAPSPAFSFENTEDGEESQMEGMENGEK